MKTLIALLISINTWVIDKPTPIPSKITELKSKSWVCRQGDGMEVLPSAGKDRRRCWLQYFISSAYAGKPVDAIQSEIAEEFPDSFLAHYTSFKTKGWTADGVDDLKAALALDDTQTISLEDQLIFAEVEERNRAKASQQVFDAGLIHSSTLNYSYNLLMSVAEDGLLLVDGLHLTVPIWVLQDVMSVRKDVTILNVGLAVSQKAYLSRVLSQKGMGLYH